MHLLLRSFKVKSTQYQQFQIVQQQQKTDSIKILKLNGFGKNKQDSGLGAIELKSCWRSSYDVSDLLSMAVLCLVIFFIICAQCCLCNHFLFRRYRLQQNFKLSIQPHWNYIKSTCTTETDVYWPPAGFLIQNFLTFPCY